MVGWTGSARLGSDSAWAQRVAECGSPAATAAALLEAPGLILRAIAPDPGGAAPIAAKFPPCLVPLDDFVAGMRGVPFVRFHEYFGALSRLDNTGGESRINGSAMYRAGRLYT